MAKGIPSEERVPWRILVRPPFLLVNIIEAVMNGTSMSSDSVFVLIDESQWRHAGWAMGESALAATVEDLVKRLTEAQDGGLPAIRKAMEPRRATPL